MAPSRADHALGACCSSYHRLFLYPRRRDIDSHAIVQSLVLLCVREVSLCKKQQVVKGVVLCRSTPPTHAPLLTPSYPRYPHYNPDDG